MFTIKFSAPEEEEQKGKQILFLTKRLMGSSVSLIEGLSKIKDDCLRTFSLREAVANLIMTYNVLKKKLSSSMEV